MGLGSDSSGVVHRNHHPVHHLLSLRWRSETNPFKHTRVYATIQSRTHQYSRAGDHRCLDRFHVHLGYLDQFPVGSLSLTYVTRRSVSSTTYVLKETNEVITNPILIAKHFVIDSWRRFGADILGALPWDILFFGNGSHSVSDSFFWVNEDRSRSKIFCVCRRFA